MTESGIRPRLATSHDAAAIVELCASAFDDDALTEWIHPDQGTRLEMLRFMFDASLGEAIASGNVITAAASDGVPLGASIWQHSSTVLTSEITGDDPLSQRMRALQHATDARRPRSPHVYLPSMAVHPARRRGGIGGIMLAAGIEAAAERGLPVSLEASSPENRRFYLRHGFDDLGGPIRVADDAPTLQPMWRDAR
ncbi:GNAT family N-acetyltransferase [Agromyces subbeticus]|uniref:GNAT family N-acetyltransferase n=1 Tax=Agromyces subbeticus TaxID=293890 RepID=UPI0003B34D53|nr:GNAT family N-acetyltransferase [Agromyces subbeticus]